MQNVSTFAFTLSSQAILTWLAMLHEEMNLFCLLTEPVALIVGNIFHHANLDSDAYRFSSSGLSKEMGDCKSGSVYFNSRFSVLLCPRVKYR